MNEINASPFEEGDRAALTREAMTHRFIAWLTRFPSIVSIAFADQEGNYLGVSRGVGGVPLSLGIASQSTKGFLEGYAIDPSGERLGRFARSRAPFDPRLRPWYFAALASNAPSWTPVYLWVTGDAGLDAVLPIHGANGILRGVLDTSLTLSGIGSFLQSIRATAHSQSFILERSGALVAASTVSAPAAPPGGELLRIAGTQSGDPIIRASSREIARALSVPHGLDEERQFTFIAAGIRQDLRVVPFRDGQGLDWLLAEVIPESDLAQHIYADMRSTAVFVALFLALSMCIALLLAGRIARPLRLLSDMARSFAKGDLSHPIGVVQGAVEVGQLAASFNVMAEELRKSFGSLAESESRYRTLFEGMPGRPLPH